MNDQAIEQQVQAKGLSAPRVSLADLEGNIAHVEIVKHVAHSGQILRWAVLTTQNGFAVTGKPSASVSAENDNWEIGEKVAVDNARSELWELMGYALKQRLYEKKPLQGVSFDQLVEHGIAQCKAEGREGNIVNGMPWSFDYKGFAVTHENDRCYLICKGAGTYRFQPGEQLVVNHDGEVLIT
ncbi:hypothetical protein EJD96_00130 (plasmid) [Herbaspirillum seropedicae]|nr:hypothetical protein EJD96_00130 [Herbaspirillum seropedicae]